MTEKNIFYSQKNIYFWFLAFSGFLFAVSLLVLLGAANDLSDSSSELKQLKVAMPALEDFVATQKIDVRLNKNQRRLKSSDIPKLVDEAIIPVNTDEAVNRTFQYFSEFENKRSASLLTVELPIVESIEPGSPSEISGVKPGDLILSVNTAKIESVLGFYLALNEKSSPDVSVKLLRNKKDTLIVAMRMADRSIITGSNCGIRFILPGDVVYLTEVETKRLAEQYRRVMLPTIPVDWRAEVANDLMQISRRLNAISKNVIDPNSANPVKLQTKDVVAWHSKKVLENIDVYFSQRRKIEARNVSHMTGIGDAFVGFVCSIFIFSVSLAVFWYQRRVSDKKS
ncbi:PDZ domain-containing protein [Polynucleobacter sp. JS-Mosq-20-D10]|uniref:PDZ domain-containing protein n=1 Tax=Polynucleobacter sp. JS-Mosq-20-D10 TaxID=2576922 RepID=UPI001BFE80A1|nr:PDZ domain-containing protein [Polynucleobacter sp. JS-Mosq-20-D10]QWE00871.1 PDZ domain-containing protein [Polynucleobacter sp. JS-Mosq-20-D10]